MAQLGRTHPFYSLKVDKISSVIVMAIIMLMLMMIIVTIIDYKEQRDWLQFLALPLYITGINLSTNLLKSQTSSFSVLPTCY